MPYITPQGVSPAYTPQRKARFPFPPQGIPVIGYRLPDGNLYLYRRRVRITEQSGNTLTDYQIRIEIGAGDPIFAHACSAGEDIRFCYYPEEEMLSYWIEKYDPDAEEAIIWVKVPEIPANSEIEIYMYYGNPEVASASDGEATFEFFDDFEGEDLDTSKWDVKTNPPKYSVANSILTIDLYDDDDWIRTYDSFGLGTAIRMFAYFKGNGQNIEGYTTSPTSTPWVHSFTVSYSWAVANGVGSATSDGGTVEKHAFTDTSPGTWDTYDLIRESPSQYIAKRADGEKGTNTHTTELIAGDASIFFHSDGGTFKCDWVLVRKYISPEPSVSVLREE